MNRPIILFRRSFSLSKRFIASFVAFNMLAVFLLFAGSSTVSAAPAEKMTDGAVQVLANAAILIDAETEQVLYQHDIDTPMAPASMSKMMTEFLVFKAVEEGRLSWDDVVTVQENASLQIGSRIYLAKGDKHTIRELYIAMAVYSANDATVQLAETVAGSEEQFAQLMNETAAELGMTNSHFINSTGLDREYMPEKYRPTSIEGETMMSARDTAHLAYTILKEDPDFLETSKIQSYKFRERDKDPMLNWNWMLESNKNSTSLKKFAYQGVDGMKTGHTDTAGNCFTGTALINGTRLIAVVFGVPGTTYDGQRFLETAKLFDYGFQSFEKKTIIEAKAVVPEHEKFEVKKGVATKFPVLTSMDLTILVPKGKVPTPEVVSVTSIEEKLTAPIAMGQKVGEVTYKYNDPSTLEDKTITVDLIAGEEVEKASWWRLFFRAIKDFFVGLFNGIVNLF
ncbi:MAG: D-alanyl-D-alanine carboxypeptidase [Candidatus Cohnella colombiensis]|uniref:serine-type D-Ala-D-Ala carboxypeptidase n=1 Tax=Candidatus Cohnella colombiensis TaxID=3121368 RepID=A0AA95EVP1_9BACL|nr:MAG: D-alanyl-D-alanine carboxypeptidase [Cohnella sp.]